jgi:hypothetical protein
MAKSKIVSFLKKTISTKTVLALWSVLSLFFLLTDFVKDRYNNYKIFRQVFFHLIDRLPLYAPYPAEYHDINHYGPLFGIIMAPFAMLPDIVGVTLWNVANALFLFYAVTKTIKDPNRALLILLLLTIEMANSMWSCQFNSAVAAMLLLSFNYIEKGEDYKSAFFIVLGTFTKLYGIVGLLFFLLSKNKTKFILGLMGWSIFFFVLPMLFSSYSFTLHAYQDWFTALAEKNNQNLTIATSQNISIPGFFRRMLLVEQLSPIVFVIIGATFTIIPFLNKKNIADKEYRLFLCALVLLFPVLFSSSAEHPTFIIPMTGAAIWLSSTSNQKKYYWTALVVGLLLFAGLGPTDLLGKSLRLYMNRNSLKAVPYLFVWILMCVEVIKKIEPPTSIPENA